MSGDLPGFELLQTLANVSAAVGISGHPGAVEPGTRVPSTTHA